MIRTGEIYWLSDCPPLDDDQDKDRPVIVVSGKEALKGDGPVIVVACSTTIRESEHDRIRLPTLADTPTCRTGLPRACWAVPRWFVVVERTRLTNYKGCISGNTLKRVLSAYMARAKPHGAS